MKPNIQCSNCNTWFYKKPNRISRSTSHYCSQKCKVKRVLVKCEFCNADISKQPNELKNDKYFCDKLCQKSYYDRQNTFKCSACGKDVYRQKAEQNESGIYICSNECRSALGNRFTSVKCVVCDKEFYKATADLERYPTHCCSVECRARNNDKRVVVKCSRCSKDMVRPPSLMTDRRIFCSVECQLEWQRDQQIQVVCYVCKKPFLVQKYRTVRQKTFCCSRECSNNSPRAFVELEFEKLLQPLGTDYKRNDRTVIAPLELDFWFPDIKYAVEINGSTHYKPIYGEEKLISTKIKDRRKRELCKQMGIKLRVIKPGDCRYETYLPRYEAVIREIKSLMKAKNHAELRDVDIFSE